MNISVVIPVWNQEKLVIRAIESVPEREGIEVIVVDDGSTDNTVKVLEDYKAKHPKRNLIIAKQKNMGPGPARNRGIRIAKGDYIVFLDSDDYFYTKEFNKFLDTHEFKADVIKVKHRSGTGREWWPKVMRGAFMKASLIKDIKHPRGVMMGEDTVFRKLIEQKEHTTEKVDLVVYYYNSDRVDSLTNLHKSEASNC